MTIAHLCSQIDFYQKWYQNLAIPPYFFNKTHDENQLNFTNVFQLLNLSLSQQPCFNYQQKTIEFVAQDDLPNDTAYECFIADTGKIPTRENFHDLLNGLIWLNFPKAKSIFNQLHHQNIQTHGISNARTALRNTLTLFDENGGVIISSSLRLLESLQNFEWEQALFYQKKCWQNAQFFAIGHALLEKLITPRKNITAHVLLILVEESFLTQPIFQQRLQLDDFLANFFLQNSIDNTLYAKMFQPLPILGIPNFWHGQVLDFYQDTSVFREKRLGEPSQIWQLKTS